MPISSDIWTLLQSSGRIPSILSNQLIMKKILVLHGPNLNRLGLREPEVYGCVTLEELNKELIQEAKVAGFMLTSEQSNSEAELITLIHEAAEKGIDYIIINPAAFTHTSIALRDALLAVKLPFIEVHISNIYAREPFRQHSYFSDIAAGVISGLGIKGYSLALQAIINELNH
ncbi:3-dehydroquinate dehydratase [Legionella jamestowniensis DSM 19215]|uniref:3-dehydroquinate dehydratase n=2 Tax=Legionella jamestowniensis TaxID=455 RepID=A0A0W0ULL7_9GAMM|nr:3-dehydroquinate dehydratase [Legionella jamestowniensis]SFL50867.1 3-dehydroquinate dehydratase [Legionella jamestowniensis DSM 19215]